MLPRGTLVDNVVSCTVYMPILPFVPDSCFLSFIWNICVPITRNDDLSVSVTLSCLTLTLHFVVWNLASLFE